MDRILGLGLGWKVTAGLGVVLFLSWIWIGQLNTKLQAKNDALVTAGYQLRLASTAIKVRDDLLRQQAQVGGTEWSQSEKECLNAVGQAYDAGVAAQRLPVRDRQSPGAFAGSLPSK